MKTHEPSNVVTCVTCDHRPEFDISETLEGLRTHLTEVHHVTYLTGTKKMVMHRDGQGFYETLYEGEIQGIKLERRVAGRK